MSLDEFCFFVIGIAVGCVMGAYLTIYAVIKVLASSGTASLRVMDTLMVLVMPEEFELIKQRRGLVGTDRVQG